MKNLFIMHTQYNLILSAAVISRRRGDHNTLVLYSEFQLTDEMRRALEGVFDRVLVANDHFVSIKKPLEEIKFIKKCVKNVNAIKKEHFDCVYMAQERIFDMIVYERVKRRNPAVKCYAVEEDAYYSLNNRYNASDYQHIETKAQKKRKRLYALCLFGYPYNYRDIHYCYGMSEEYHGVQLLFPDLARKEIASKELREIRREELLCGIHAIYANKNTEYPEAQKYMVMFFDLLSRYKNPTLVKELVRAAVQKCKEQGRCVLMKYHPREVEKFTEFDQVVEIDKLIPAEKVLYDLRDKDVVVFGNATTACIVAAKLGYDVNSICRLEIPDNIKMHDTMMKMGVSCIETIEDIKI